MAYTAAEPAVTKQDAPSTLDIPTASENPLDTALKKLMTTKTAKEAQDEMTGIGYTPYSAAPSQPVGDTVTINAQPGTGATQAETWTHESQLGSALQTSLEFEAQQRQKAEENARAEAQLAMSKAEASRQAALGGPQLQAAQLANQQTQQAMALAKAANDRAELDAFIKSGGFSLADWNRIKTGMAQTQSYLGGRPTTPELASAQQQVYSRQYAPAPGGGTA